MGKRGPQPAHETLTPLPRHSDRRPPPPEGMTEAQARMWREVTESEPAGWFDSAARQHLLRLYVEHMTFRADLQVFIDRSPAEKVCDEISGKSLETMLRARERETKQIISLATRLRLTNQSRYTPGAAGTAERNDPHGPRPWEDDPLAEFM
jgi:hypothetical protein